jgi:hypothetical protein
MAAVQSTAPGGPRVRTPVYGTGGPVMSRAQNGSFRVYIETSQPAPWAPERGHRNEYPHAGVRVAGD